MTWSSVSLQSGIWTLNERLGFSYTMSPLLDFVEIKKQIGRTDRADLFIYSYIQYIQKYIKNVYKDDAAPFTGSCQSIGIMATQVGWNSTSCGWQKYISHRRLNNLWIQSNKWAIKRNDTILMAKQKVLLIYKNLWEIEWRGAVVVICLQQGARDMVHLMLLPTHN